MKGDDMKNKLKKVAKRMAWAVIRECPDGHLILSSQFFDSIHKARAYYNEIFDTIHTKARKYYFVGECKVAQ